MPNTIVIVDNKIVDIDYAAQKQSHLESRIDKVLDQISMVVDLIIQANLIISNDIKDSNNRVDNKFKKLYS